MRTFADTQGEPLKSAVLDKAAEMEKSGPDLSGPVQEVETYRMLMEKFGIDSNRRPKHGSKIAKLVEESAMFDPRFKIYSKIAHPTALSIASTVTPNSLDALLPLISSDSGNDLLAIFSSIEDHVEAYGVSPRS